MLRTLFLASLIALFINSASAVSLIGLPKPVKETVVKHFDNWKVMRVKIFITKGKVSYLIGCIDGKLYGNIEVKAGGEMVGLLRDMEYKDCNTKIQKAIRRHGSKNSISRITYNEKKTGLKEYDVLFADRSQTMIVLSASGKLLDKSIVR